MLKTIFLFMLKTSKANFATIPTSSSIVLSKVDGISKISLSLKFINMAKCNPLPNNQ
jgi:hypothetical protein